MIEIYCPKCKSANVALVNNSELEMKVSMDDYHLGMDRPIMKCMDCGYEKSLGGKPMKPSEIPCPKCGSLKVIRRFYLKDDTVDCHFIPRDSKFVVTPPPPAPTKSGHTAYSLDPVKAGCDCFLHWCQDCGWRWETDEMYENTKT